MRGEERRNMREEIILRENNIFYHNVYHLLLVFEKSIKRLPLIKNYRNI